MFQICALFISHIATYSMHCHFMNLTQHLSLFEKINHILAKHTSKFCIYQHIPTDDVHYVHQAIHSTLLVGRSSSTLPMSYLTVDNKSFRVFSVRP